MPAPSDKQDKTEGAEQQGQPTVGLGDVDVGTCEEVPAPNRATVALDAVDPGVVDESHVEMTTVRLTQEIKEVGNAKEAVTRARVFGAYADTWLRIILALVIAAIFGYLNWQVMDFVRAGFTADQENLKTVALGFKPGDRLVTAQVVMSLIGATVVQVGITVVAIVSYLFPKTTGEKKESD